MEEKKKYAAERQGHYVGAKLTVMQPRVVNQNNVPKEGPLENVARDGCDKCGHQNSENCNTCPDLDCGIYKEGGE